MECILIRRKVEFFVLKLLLMFFFISGSFYRQEFQKTLLMRRLIQMVLAWTRLQYHPLTFFKNHAIIPISCHHYRFLCFIPNIVSYVTWWSYPSTCGYVLADGWPGNSNINATWSSPRIIDSLKVYGEKFWSLHAARGPWQFLDYTIIATGLF